MCTGLRRQNIHLLSAVLFNRVWLGEGGGGWNPTSIMQIMNNRLAPMISLLLHSSGSEWLRVNKYPSSYQLCCCSWGSVDLNLIHILWCTFSIKIERSISIIGVLFVSNGNDFEAKIFYPILWGFNATQHKRNAVLSIVLSPTCMKLNNLKSPSKKLDETEVENVRDNSKSDRLSESIISEENWDL